MTLVDQNGAAGVQAAPAQREIIYRHTVVVRVTHWINVFCLALLLMSGLRIFDAHPALYWGNYGYYGVRSFLSVSSTFDDITARPTGVTRIGDHSFDTTGFLGISYDSAGQPLRRAFPGFTIEAAAKRCRPALGGIPISGQAAPAPGKEFGPGA